MDRTGPDQDHEKFQNLRPDQKREKFPNLGPDHYQQNLENFGPIRNGRSPDLAIRGSLVPVVKCLTGTKQTWMTHDGPEFEFELVKRDVR